MLSMTATESGSKTLERLLARIASTRDQSAFAALYSATKGKLFSTVLMIVKRRDLAEEVIQDVFVRIWSNASTYRPSFGAPMTWMISIARNLAIDLVRRPIREVCSDESVLLAFPSDCPTAVEAIEAVEDHRSAIEQQQKMLSALQALDPARRDLVIAAYIHGESREQLSRRTGVPVSTVKTWLRRTLLEVEAVLRNTEKEEDLDPSATPANPGGIARRRKGHRDVAMSPQSRGKRREHNTLSHR
jgi:RNA polymerase sigma-70 factor, ECF subfamily